MTLNDFCKLMRNYKIILVYTDYEENWVEGEFRDEFGDLEGYVAHEFSIKGERTPDLYLKEKYANANVVRASIYDRGIIRAQIEVDE